MSDCNHLPWSLLDHIRDAVVIADGDGLLLGASAAFVAFSGSDPVTAKDGDGLALQSALSQALLGKANHWNGPLPVRDGASITVDMQIHRIPDGDEQTARLIGVIDLQPSPESGLMLARDSTTGLPSRSVFADRVEQALHIHKRQGGSVVLMMIGLDHFTLVNDGFGHDVGDRLLALVADRIRACVRETDSAIRLDGDKFAVLLAVTAADDVIIVADKVMAVTATPYGFDDHEILQTFSIGIASYPEDAATMEQLIQRAENSLHHAKSAGRNQYQFYSKDMAGKALSRLDLATRIRRGLKNDEFHVYYQPKVRSDDHSIIGAEALARWKDPELGLIMPADFIPVAEETGLIEDIGRRILAMACKQTRKWQLADYEPITIAVNVSPRQFRNSRLVDIVTDILAETQLDPRWLELELTESMIVHDVEGAVRKMQALRNFGISIAIDDFGTGYSSLSSLGKFPLTSLKIDRAFITDVDTNPKTAELARAIIGLSKGLNLGITAEGCEQIEHLKFLEENGCDSIQGFYFSKPVPATEFEAMLRAGVVYPVPTFEE